MDAAMSERRGQTARRVVPRLGLPARPFLYTLDQIATILSLEEATVRKNYVHYEGRSIGVALRDQLIARNIAPADQKPEWRVAERELIRWMKQKGYKYYDAGTVTH